MDLFDDPEFTLVVFIAVVVLILFLAIVTLSGRGKSAAGPRERFCPLCRRKMEPGETVLGIIMSTQPPQKIMIRGCRVCATRESRDDNPNEWGK